MAERCWTVGSLPDCDIRVENAAVSGRHCRLTQRGESLLLEDLGSTNGTFVAGERISRPRIVRRGDPVTLGRNTPLPWPPMVRSVTIGRLPENDVVIPLDMVSGKHARLDVEGETVNLTDLNSSNGTAINDPTNKITRAVIQPTDFVYFGTHRVPAWELLKALPKSIERHTTLLEGSAPPGLERELASRDAGSAPPFGGSTWERMRSRSSWIWGIALSALVAATILGAPLVLRSTSQRASEDRPVIDGEGDTHDAALTLDSSSSPAKRDTDRKQIPAGGPHERPARLPRSEANRQSERTATGSLTTAVEIPPPQAATALLGIRAGNTLVITTDTVWAYRPDAVICPTAVLDLLQSRLVANKEKHKQLDASLVVCTPQKTLAILEHKAGYGSAEGFSMAKLEAPLDAVCKTADREPAPGQHLTMLTCQRQQHDNPASIVRKLQRLKIDRIERSPEKAPLLLHCSGETISGDVQGSPLFDEGGSVVGCARASAGEVEVVPLARLAELLSTKQ